MLISSIVSSNTSHKADVNEMYSASEVLRAVSVCNDLCQYMGQFAYMMTIPVRDITFSELLESAWCQPPAKSAST